MKRSLALIALLGFAATAHSAPLRVLTEVYPPYSFLEGTEVKGAGADQVHLMMKANKIDYTMDILPWARAYSMVTHDKNTCIYAAAHTEERDKLFKWVEPLGGGRVVIVSKAGSPANPKTLEEAKSFAIGVQRGDYATDYLIRKGFSKLDQAADFSLTMRKLASNRIDLAVSSESAYKAEKAKGNDLEVVLFLPPAIYALACSLDVPDATISALQQSLNDLILSGKQDELYVKYGMPAQNMQSFVQKTD